MVHIAQKRNAFWKFEQPLPKKKKKKKESYKITSSFPCFVTQRLTSQLANKLHLSDERLPAPPRLPDLLNQTDRLPHLKHAALLDAFQPRHDRHTIMLEGVAAGGEHWEKETRLGGSARSDLAQRSDNLADVELDFGIRGGFAEDAAMELDEPCPVKGVVCGDEFDGVGRVEIGAVAAVVAPLLDVLAGFVQVRLDLFGLTDGFRCGTPVRADVAVLIDALVVACVSEFGYAGEDGDAATGEAHETVDLVALHVIFGFELEVVAVEEGEIPASAKATQHVQVGKPAG